MTRLCASLLAQACRRKWFLLFSSPAFKSDPAHDLHRACSTDNGECSGVLRMRDYSSWPARTLACDCFGCASMVRRDEVAVNGLSMMFEGNGKPSTPIPFPLVETCRVLNHRCPIALACPFPPRHGPRLVIFSQIAGRITTADLSRLVLETEKKTAVVVVFWRAEEGSVGVDALHPGEARAGQARQPGHRCDAAAEGENKKYLKGAKMMMSTEHGGGIMSSRERSEMSGYCCVGEG